MRLLELIRLPWIALGIIARIMVAVPCIFIMALFMMLEGAQNEKKTKEEMRA